MTATLFELRAPASGNRVLWALVCPELRYASLIASQAAAPIRRSATDDQWAAVAREMPSRLLLGPLPDDSGIARLLAGADEAALTVRYIRSYPVDDATVTEASLDALLRSHTFGPIPPPATQH